MDPFSIAASVISVLGVAGQCVEGITRLRGVKEAPAEYLALVNEIADLQVVLTQVIALKERLDQNRSDGSVTALKSLLRRAQDQLLELNALVRGDFSKSKSKNSPSEAKVSRLRWTLSREQLASRQQSLRTTRLNLATALGVVNSCALTRIELAVQSISTYRAVDTKLIQQILGQVATAANGMESSEGGSMSAGLFPNSSIAKLRSHRVDSDRQWSTQSDLGQVNPNLVSSINIKARASTFRISCKPWCSCACHRQRTLRYPDWLRKGIGGLFVGYTAIPVFSPSCTETNCQQRSSPAIEATYHFPSWLLSRVISLNLHLSSLSGPELTLRMPRMVNRTTPLWQHSQLGRFDVIQQLFGTGKASPYDVNAYGQSSLHYAASTGCIELCRFLIQQNADVNLRDENGRPIDSAWDMVLSNMLSAQATSEMAALFSDSEYLETRQFTVLHKIVLGLSPGSILGQLNMLTALINVADANGRTCLSWAAARGDLTSVNALISVGANARIADNEGCPPGFYAIKAKSLPCVSALINSLASFRVIDAFGGTGLQVTSTSFNDPTMIRMLVEEGQLDINAIDFDGDTALNYAARARHGKNATYLLDKGADPNIANVAGETVVHMAIHWGALETLRELVLRGVDFSLINSRRESVLHAIASAFDPQIFESLKLATSLSDIDTELKDIDGFTCFDRLRVIDDEAATRERIATFQNFLSELGNSSEAESDEFEDAVEILDV